MNEDEWSLREWLNLQDLDYIKWSDAFQHKGWTESLIREYSHLFSIVEWAMLYCYIEVMLDADFYREFRKELNLHTRDGEILTIRGKKV